MGGASMTLRPSLGLSFAVCRMITRRAKSSFPLAFRLLAEPKRRAMDALYAFSRLTDDYADEPGDIEEKRARLTRWRILLHDALAGDFGDPILEALVDTIKRYDIPAQWFFDLIDGVEMDLAPVRFETFEELHRYCYRVASAVGLACVRIWGVRPGVSWECTHEPSEAAGVAFQLTNIIRDLGEDAARGRDYFPQDDHKRFPDRIDLVNFEIGRARECYRRATALDGLLTDDGRAIFRVMSGTYRALLERIAKEPEAVFGQRVSVPRWQKALMFVGAWPVKWGWL
jgi:phytoene synthase